MSNHTLFVLKSQVNGVGKGNYYNVQKCCRIPLRRGKYYVDKCCMIASRMHADAVSVPLGANVLALRGSGSVESAHSRGQLSPNTSHILCSTTQDETTWGTFSSLKSSLFRRQRHCPFSRPNAFSTTILALLWR